MDELIGEYANSERGMEIREIAGGYRIATKPEYHDAVRGFVKSLKPPMKLSLQALETLAVIAYKQPVTAPEVSEIRGVDSGGVLGNLVSRKLITTAGRKPVIGRPILYKTTKEFLLRFGLKDVNDLPSMEEFEKMAGELAESEAEGEAQDAGNLVADEAATDPQPGAEAEQDAPEAQQTQAQLHKNPGQNRLPKKRRQSTKPSTRYDHHPGERAQRAAFAEDCGCCRNRVATQGGRTITSGRVQVNGQTVLSWARRPTRSGIISALTANCSRNRSNSATSC